MAGAGVGVMLTYRDSPPQYIENWRQGMEGERSTARRLSRLPKRDWRVWHDITLWGASNIDHVVVGNSGVYLLDSKQYFGTASLESGVLRVQHFEEASGFYEVPWLTNTMVARGAHFSEELARVTGMRVWVHPVVVLWCPFEQRVADVRGVVFVHGHSLVKWLAERTQTLSPFQLNRIIAAVDALAATVAEPSAKLSS